ncbi:hypothetical protein K435DRAFT_964382 [Dendrothele bispora CBS 962.96]|uniref:HNH nuclease domain-containing protein n=1 Tax=Dendrothele bispora (strain CBS 962.96) TaxID=1314807 RepID=A0A4S8MBD9_DENBC|nr:hypothetical protein K435DRAFT_964382 [Dendrothele bispora CBS 962.96]
MVVMLTHIVKHSKGDAYMQRLLQPAGPDDKDVTEIDSPANGPILNLLLHRAAGSGVFASIRTPFSDVLKSSDLHEKADDGRVMLTAHYIRVDVYPNRLLPVQPNHGVSLETPSDIPLPPCYFFVAVYISHCLHMGDKLMVDKLFIAWSDQYGRLDKEQKEKERAERQGQRDKRSKPERKGKMMGW